MQIVTTVEIIAVVSRHMSFFIYMQSFLTVDNFFIFSLILALADVAQSSVMVHVLIGEKFTQIDKHSKFIIDEPFILAI